jgi:hypothetical protein
MLILSTQSNSEVVLRLGFYLGSDHLPIILCAPLCVNKLEILLWLLQILYYYYSLISPFLVYSRYYSHYGWVLVIKISG